MDEVENVLQHLQQREDGPFVVRLAREPGKRESRFMHLFSGEVDDAVSSSESDDVSASSASVDGTLAARVCALENEVAELRAQLAALQARLA
jgi:uncharacterized protein YceH (UPF0502 family)